ncbi:MAG TPA: hypothetical protein VGG04_09420 [Candidatus Sulfotelmatobacter sp.]|jgi:hypothetical protein
MKRRIAIWASAGFVIAGLWAIYAFVAQPPALTSGDPLTALCRLTCPIALLGAHYPISIYTALLANAATYGLLGAAIETARQLKVANPK